MADGRELLEFVIHAFSPDTVPMARLAEYMGDLAQLLGEREHVHFVELRPSSLNIVHAVDLEALPRVDERVVDARDGRNAEARKAFDRIDDRLREDKADAELRRPAGGKLLHFPGANRKRDVEQEFGPFKQQSQLYGVPVSVGGVQRLSNVNLQDGEKTHYCEASREMAVEIAPLIYRYRLRVYGTATFYRNTAGRWDRENFRITSYDVLDGSSLRDTLEQLRSITRSNGMEDGIIAKMAELRREA
jgi:hypothetical protein